MMNTRQRICIDESGSDLFREQFGQYSQMDRIFRQTRHNPKWKKVFLKTILTAALICVAACGSPDSMKPGNGQVLDLMDRLSPAGSIQRDEQFQPNQLVIRKGLRRNAIIIVAPVCIQASLQGVSGKAMLKGWAAPVYNIGDGLRMDLYISRRGIRYQVGSRYFDPGRKAGDRDWIPIEVPLEIAEGEEDRLEIEISAGPQGDLVADWLALSSLSLFRVNP